MLQPARRTDTQPLRAPGDGKVIRLQVSVPCFASWDEALQAGAPDEKRAGALDRAKTFTAPSFTRPLRSPLRNFVCMWAGPGEKTTPSEAQAWGRQNNLLESAPYDVCGLSKVYPQLYRRFLLKGCGIIATETGQFEELPYVFGVWQSKDMHHRNSGLIRADLSLHDRTIFVYEEPE